MWDAYSWESRRHGLAEAELYIQTPRLLSGAQEKRFYRCLVSVFSR